jgi:hypothetical protein
MIYHERQVAFLKARSSNDIDIFLSMERNYSHSSFWLGTLSEGVFDKSLWKSVVNE